MSNRHLGPPTLWDPVLIAIITAVGLMTISAILALKGG